MELVEAVMRVMGSAIALAAGVVGLGGAIAALSSRRRREKHEEWLNTMVQRKSLPAGVTALFARERDRTAAKLAAALWVPIGLWAFPTSIAVVALVFFSGYVFTGFSWNDYFNLFDIEPSATATNSQLETVAWQVSWVPAIFGLLFVSSLRNSIRALGRREYLAHLLLDGEAQSLPKRDKIPTDFPTNWLTAIIVLAAWFLGGVFGIGPGTNGWVSLFVWAGLMATCLITVVKLSD